MTLSIYHGNNENWIKIVEEFSEVSKNRWLPSNLTDNPSEAMQFAFEMSQKFDSRPVVLEYLCSRKYFKKENPGCKTYSIGGRTNWYHPKTIPDKAEESPLIKIYSEKDLQKLLEEKIKSSYELKLELSRLEHLFNLLNKE